MRGYKVLEHLEKNKKYPKAVAMISSKPLTRQEVSVMISSTKSIYHGEVTYIPIPDNLEGMKDWVPSIIIWTKSNI